MRSKTTLLALAGLAALAAAGAAQTPQALELSLDEAILRALKSNVGLKVAEYGPASADLSIERAQEKYLPSFSFSYSNRHTERVSYSFLDVAGATSVTKTNNFQGSVNQSIPLGGRVTVSMSNGLTDTNQKGNTINPQYNTQLNFSFTQPLLRDFGAKFANREITVARNAYDVSELNFARTVQDLVHSVTQTYWNLVYAVENLKVQETSLKLAKDFLAKNQRSVEIGTLAPMDVLSAEAEVASREASILSAQSQVRNYEDQLRNLMNLSAEEEKRWAAVLPSDKPKFEERPVDFNQAIAVALEKRTDLRISKINLQTTDLNLAYARNQLLPSLSLTAGYQSPGLSGTQILYEGNPLFGTVIGTIPGGFSDALKDSFRFKYPNWNISLSLDIPLSNVISKASYAQSKLAMDQALLELENQHKSAVLEVRNAVRQLQTNFKLVQANRVARELAEKKLAAEEEKLRVGQSTNYTVLQFQRDLTSSRVAELNAIINYNIAQSSLDRATGTLLEARNIKVLDLLAK
ncbi:MAG: TolC family protein [Candidatus Aminicenantes bacterium]|nr:TolC family protein [Candidatus Aminicenantes bacterium]